MFLRILLVAAENPTTSVVEIHTFTFTPSSNPLWFENIETVRLVKLSLFLLLKLPQFLLSYNNHHHHLLLSTYFFDINSITTTIY